MNPKEEWFRIYTPGVDPIVGRTEVTDEAVAGFHHNKALKLWALREPCCTSPRNCYILPLAV